VECIGISPMAAGGASSSMKVESNTQRGLRVMWLQPHEYMAQRQVGQESNLQPTDR